MANVPLSIFDYIEVAESILKSLAIIIGGFWTYHLFVQRRQRFPRVKVEHQIQHYLLEQNKMLLTVKVRITNDGDVLLPLTFMITWVRQLLPTSPASISRTIPVEPDKEDDLPPLAVAERQWKQINRHKSSILRFSDWLRGHSHQGGEIEPKETDEFFYCFTLDTVPKSILITTIIDNSAKGNKLSWKARTVYDLKERTTTSSRVLTRRKITQH